MMKVTPAGKSSSLYHEKQYQIVKSNSEKMDSYNKIAILTGIGYLVIFITGVFSNFFVLENLIVSGDAAATAENIMEGDMIFRLGILSFIIMVILDLLLAWTLYVLLRPVHKDLSLLAGWLRLVNGTVFGIALFGLFNVLQMISGADYLEAFETGQLQAQVMLSLDAFNNTWLIGLVFFGFHLLLLGYLIIRSGYIPRIIGYLLVLASLGYLIDSFANFLLPGYSKYETIFMMIVVIPGVVGELSLTFWLLIKGGKLKVPHVTL
jgi:hypothetical protein